MTAWSSAHVNGRRHECQDGAFVTTLESGEQLRSAEAVIATGVRDKRPDVEGIQELYGRSVFHCTYCDGWEIRDQRLRYTGVGNAATACRWS